MESLITRDVNDISPIERAAIENLLGQPLSSEQKVFLMAFTPGAAADPAARAAARNRLERTLEGQGKRATRQEITAEEADLAVDEAMQHVRPRSE